MRLFLLASLICLCYSFHKSLNFNQKLPVLGIARIREKIHERHFVIGLHPSADTVLKSLAWLYRNESSLEIGLWNQTDLFDATVLWDNSVNEFQKQNAKIAFFQRIPKDRKCFITPKVLVKAIPITGKSVEKVIAFLNDKCFLFVNLNGMLESAGELKNDIKKNFYKVPTSNNRVVKCDRIPLPNSREEFIRTFLFRSKPVIIENAFNDWTALRRWSNDFLRRGYGDKKVHVKLTPNGEFEGCDLAKKFENFQTFEIPDQVKSRLLFPDLVVVRPAVGNMKFGEFLDLVEGKEAPVNISAYLEYSSIRSYFPELEEDLSELPFLKGLLKLLHLNMWLSNGKTLGKLHFDPYDNILCQLRGNKRFTVFEPHNNYNLYEAHIQEGILKFNPDTGKFHNAELLDSTSMVMSPIDILAPDYSRFPNFTKANAMECFLNEGDALYLPSFWWHEVQSFPSEIERRNLAVDFWYKPFLTKEFPCIDCQLDINPIYRKLLEKFS